MSKKNYLNQRDFFTEIVSSKIQGRISEKLGRMFMMLAEKYANHPHYNRYYHLRDDLVAVGAQACCRSFPQFRPHKDAETEWDGQTEIDYDFNIHSNAFAFFTTCIKNAFLQFLKKEYYQKNVTNKMRVEEGLDPSYGYNEMLEAQEEARSQEEIEVENTIDDIEEDAESNHDLWRNYSEENSLVDIVTEDQEEIEVESDKIQFS